jgi:hypothetical protein
MSETPWGCHSSGHTKKYGPNAGSLKGPDVAKDPTSFELLLKGLKRYAEIIEKVLDQVAPIYQRYGGPVILEAH